MPRLKRDRGAGSYPSRGIKTVSAMVSMISCSDRGEILAAKPAAKMKRCGGCGESFESADRSRYELCPTCRSKMRGASR